MLTAAFDRFLFPASTARRLALFRIGFYLAALPFLAYWFHYYTATDFPPELFQYKLLGGLPLPSIEASPRMTIVLGIFLLASAAGFLTVFSETAVALLGLCLFGNPVQYGVHPETACPFLICCAIMPFARDADAWSVDAWLRKRVRAPADVTLYAWPTQVVRALWVWVFFSAGCLKLRYTGIDWATHDGLGSFLIIIPYMQYPAPGDLTRLSAFLLDHPLITQLGSYFTVVMELAMPLAMVSRRMRALLIPTAILMLLFVLLSLKPPFFYSMLPLCFAWLPWFSPAARSPR